MKELLNALNAYATRMRMGETDCPIVFRRVRLNDTLVDDTFVSDASIEDIDRRIETGHFASGNYFALADDNDFVYCNERIADNLNCLYLWFSEKSMLKGLSLHKRAYDKKAKALIKEITDVIKPPYHVYAVGLTNSSRNYINDGRTSDMIVFNYGSGEAHLTAYKHMAAYGMKRLPQVGKTPKHLYIYRRDGKELPKGFM
jgi:hypothetical protein